MSVLKIKDENSGQWFAVDSWGDYYILSLTATLSAASWSSNEQTISNAEFVASGFAYIVAPASTSYTDYTEAIIYAENVSTDGYMTFHCSEEPTTDIIVNILKVKI